MTPLLLIAADLAAITVLTSPCTCAGTGAATSSSPTSV